MKDLLTVHDLAREELGDRERGDVRGRGDVADEAADLRTGQAAGDGTQAKDDLVAVDRVDVEVDRDP